VKEKVDDVEEEGSREVVESKVYHRGRAVVNCLLTSGVSVHLLEAGVSHMLILTAYCYCH
jgi:hypothetical protein